MADYYCDHALYPAYAATPSWGIAQDGDGLATGLAVSATVIIDLSSSGATAGNTFNIMGVGLTCVASGAIDKQFNAGSGATLATSLAASINATTTAVTPSAANWGAPQLRARCYARAIGASLELMTRQGSAIFNANSLCKASSSGFTGPAVDAPFSGGVSGAWGYFINDAALGIVWPNAAAKWTYGIFIANCYAGPTTPALTDRIILRCNNKVISSNGAEPVSMTCTDKYFVADNGTTWPGDTGTLTVRLIGYGSGSMSIGAATNSTLMIESLTEGRFIIEFASTAQFAQFGVGTATSSKTIAVRVRFVDNCTGAGGGFLYAPISLGMAMFLYKCKYINNRTSWQNPFSLATAFSGLCLRVEDMDFSHPNLVAAPGNLVVASIMTTLGAPNSVIFRRCKIDVLANPASIASSCYGHFLFEDMEGFAISASLNGFVGSYTLSGGDLARSVLMQNVGVNKTFRIEAPGAVVDWIDSAGYPTLNALLPNGTYWAYRVLWSAAFTRKFDPYQVLTLTKTNVLATAARTLTLELLLNSTYAASIKSNHIAITVAYVNNLGKMVSETTYPGFSAGLANSGEVIPSSTAAWTLNSYSGHAARKIVLTTAQPVAQNTEVEVSVMLYDSAPTSVQDFFVNPELGIE